MAVEPRGAAGRACSSATPWARPSGCSPGSIATIGPIYTPRRRRAAEPGLSRARASPCPRRPTPADAEGARTGPGALIVAPPSANGTPWSRKFGRRLDRVRLGLDADPRARRRRRSVDRGFVLSDHADWPGLLAAIEATGAEHILSRTATPPSSPAASASAGSTPTSSPPATRASATTAGPRTERRRRPTESMKAFADLYAALDETTKTNDKVDALVALLRRGRRRRRGLGRLFPDRPQAAAGRPLGEAPRLGGGRGGGIPDWLFDESYDAVGDLAETIALAPADARSRRATVPLRDWVEERLLPLRSGRGDAQHEAMLAAWARDGPPQRFVWNKLITGGRSASASRSSSSPGPWRRSASTDAATIAHRLMGDWEPTPALLRPPARRPTTPPTPTSAAPIPSSSPTRSKPSPPTLGPIDDWQAEWKWDGIRSPADPPRRARPSSGPAARSSSPTLPRARRASARSCPTAP